jgi:hypothetical protein
MSVESDIIDLRPYWVHVEKTSRPAT